MTIAARAGEEGKLFGSVTSAEIADAIREPARGHRHQGDLSRLAQRLEVLPNCPASLRSDSGLAAWRLAR